MEKQLITATVPEIVVAFLLKLNPILEQFLLLQTQRQPVGNDRMTQKEVLKLLKVTKPTLYADQRAGIITPHYIKEVKSLYFLRNEIEKLFKTKQH